MSSFPIDPIAIEIELEANALRSHAKATARPTYERVNPELAEMLLNRTRDLLALMAVGVFAVGFPLIAHGLRLAH